MTTNRLLRHWHAIYIANDPGQAGECWTVAGVTWSRERHVFWGATHSFRIEFHTLICPRPRPWRLFVIKELFFGQNRGMALKDAAWCKVDEGSPHDTLAWMETNLPAGYRMSHEPE